jgi:hypothetical protein
VFSTICGSRSPHWTRFGPHEERRAALHRDDDYFLLPDGSVTTLDAINPILKDVPLWQAYPGDTLNGDFTNCFAPIVAVFSPRLKILSST